MVTITATIRVPGLHRWPGASGVRAYLADEHRHLFHITAEVTVNHDDRDIEWHDLQTWMIRLVGNMAEGEQGGCLRFGTRSCEALARELSEALPESWRSVSWSEDGEFTATVRREDAA